MTKRSRHLFRALTFAPLIVVLLMQQACSMADAFTEKLSREMGQAEPVVTTQSIKMTDPAERADKMIRTGESLVMEGRDLIADGQARIAKGERMAAQGRQLKEEAKAGHIDRTGIVMN